MNGDLIAFLVGAGAGLLFLALFILLRREEVKRSWDARRTELFGEEELTRDDPARRSESAPAPRRRHFAIVLSVLALLGCGFVATQTSDPVLRWVNLACCMALALGMLMLARQESRSGSRDRD